MVWYGMVLQSARSSTRTSGALARWGEHSAGIQMSNLFIAWHSTNFPGISHHKKNDFTIHIWHLLWSSAVPGEEVGEGVVDREGLAVALEPHHAAARVAASRGQGETEDSNQWWVFLFSPPSNGRTLCLYLHHLSIRALLGARQEVSGEQASAAMFH